MLWTKKETAVSRGKSAEQFAAAYLENQGLVFAEQNFQNRAGEIDLIMKDQDTWVFIEVKYRREAKFGGAISAITVKKQQKIRQCAIFYLQKSGLNEYNTPCRFDVVALQGDITKPEVTWLKNAF